MNLIFNGTLMWTNFPPSYVPGLNGGQALSFTAGSGQYVQLPTGPGPFDATVGYPFTFECFFQLASLPAAAAVLAQRDQTWALTITPAGDVNLTLSGVSVPIAAGVTLVPGTWYHVAVVYDGRAWYICLAGNVAGPRTTGYDGGAAGPVTQSIGGAAGNAGGTIPGLITEARVSTSARYPAGPYTVPAAPLAWDFRTLTMWSMDGTVNSTNLLVLSGPGGGNPGSAYATFAAALVGPVAGTVTVNLSDGFSTQHFLPPSVDLSNAGPTQPFTYLPDGTQAGTAVTIRASAPAGSGVSPAVYLFYIYSAQAYTLAAAAPYGVGFPGLAGALGYWLLDPADPAQALYWSPGTGGVTEQVPGTGVYLALVQIEPGWTRVLEWDASIGMSPFVTVINTSRPPTP